MTQHDDHNDERSWSVRRQARELGRTNRPTPEADRLSDVESALVDEAQQKLSSSLSEVPTMLDRLRVDLASVDRPDTDARQVMARQRNRLVRSLDEAGRELREARQHVATAAADLGQYVDATRSYRFPTYSRVQDVLRVSLWFAAAELLAGAIAFGADFEGGLLEALRLTIFITALSTLTPGIAGYMVGAMQLGTPGRVLVGAVASVVVVAGNAITGLERSRAAVAEHADRMLTNNPPIDPYAVMFAILACSIAPWIAHKAWSLHGSDPELTRRDRNFGEAAARYGKRRDEQRSRHLASAGRLEPALNTLVTETSARRKQVDAGRDQVSQLLTNVVDATKRANDWLATHISTFRAANLAVRTQPGPAYFALPCPMLTPPEDLQLRIRELELYLERLHESVERTGVQKMLDDAASATEKAAVEFDALFPEPQHPLLRLATAARRETGSGSNYDQDDVVPFTSTNGAATLVTRAGQNRSDQRDCSGTRPAGAFT